MICHVRDSNCASRHPWARDLNPSNVLATEQGLKVIDFEFVESPTDALRKGIARRVWDFVRIARLTGGGESRDIWKVGPLCIKRWSRQVSPAEVRLRCRDSRRIPVCTRMRYVPWLHWTLARWVHCQPATHTECNAILAAYSVLRDIHPGNVLARSAGLAVIDFEADIPAGPAVKE